MIKRMLVILIFLISILCLTSVNASDLDSLDLAEDDNSIDALEIADSSSISSYDMDNDVEKNDDSNKVFIGNDESDFDEDVSLANEKVLSTDKKTKLGDSTDLELDNDADKENIKVGDLVTWILEAKNKGQNVAKNVKVLDQLPDGLKLVDYSATKGTFNVSTGIWDIGYLEAGENQVLKLITKALTPGKKVNKANLTSDTESTVPDECYEEEEIDVYGVGNYKKVPPKRVTNLLLHPTGNPIAVLLVSILIVLTANIKRRY